MLKIVVLISGFGTNLQAIIDSINEKILMRKSQLSLATELKQRFRTCAGTKNTSLRNS